MRRYGLFLLAVLPACFPFDPEVDAETQDLLERSGAFAAIPALGIAQDGTILVGKLDLKYDDTQTPFRPFRLAAMVKCKDGSAITDFFHDAPLPKKQIRSVGHGNFRGMVPRVSANGTTYNTSVARFADDFPGFIDTTFPLTFKEFGGDAFFLKDAPDGTYYFWFQTGYDGNRVTQQPLAIDLEIKEGSVTRHDIVQEDFRQLFYML